MRSNTKTSLYEPHNEQVAFNSAPFKVVDPKTGHHWQHELSREATTTYAHPRTRINTLENQVTTQGGPTSRDGHQFQTWRLSFWANHQPGQTITMEVTAAKDMVKSGSMSASEVNTVHLPASARSKKRKDRLATFDRHAKSFRSLCGRLTGVEDHYNVNSRCSKIPFLWTQMKAGD